MRAKDCVPAGGSFQERAGEMFLPVQAYFAGMDCPFRNASLVSVRDMVASVAGASAAVVEKDVAIGSADSVVRVAGAHAASKKKINPYTIPDLMTSLLFELLRIA
jgi:hypothetical protein